MNATEHAPDLDLALARVHSFFEGRKTKEGVLARLMHRPHPQDQQLTGHLIRERRLRTRMDGSVDGSLMSTAWTAWELLELGCLGDNCGVIRMLGYLLAQQDKPGHVFEGCTPLRHDRGTCCHSTGGFFSAATRDENLAPLKFPSGVEIEGEEYARLAASCFTLRVVLRAGEGHRKTVRQHVESLLAIADQWTSGSDDLSPDLFLFVLGALAVAPLEYRTKLDEYVSRILELQQPSGEIPNTNIFHMFDMLVSIPSATVREAMSNAVHQLTETQHDGGAFDQEESEIRALIGLRVLSLVSDSPRRSGGWRLGLATTAQPTH